MTDFIPVARAKRGKGPRTTKQKRKLQAREGTLPERKPTERQLRKDRRLAGPVY